MKPTLGNGARWKAKGYFHPKRDRKFYRLALPKSDRGEGVYTLIWPVISRRFFRIFSHKMLILAIRAGCYHVR